MDFTNRLHRWCLSPVIIGFGFDTGSTASRASSRTDVAIYTYSRTGGFHTAFHGAGSRDAQCHARACAAFRTHAADRAPARRMARLYALDAEISNHVER